MHAHRVIKAIVLLFQLWKSHCFAIVSLCYRKTRPISTLNIYFFLLFRLSQFMNVIRLLVNALCMSDYIITVSIAYIEWMPTCFASEQWYVDRLHIHFCTELNTLYLSTYIPIHNIDAIMYAVWLWHAIKLTYVLANDRKHCDEPIHNTTVTASFNPESSHIFEWMNNIRLACCMKWLFPNYILSCNEMMLWEWMR